MDTQSKAIFIPFHRRYRVPLLVLILLLAAAGRIFNIDAESLWVDEGFSYWAIRHDDMFHLIREDVHPPVYFYMLRGWAQAAGITELALRYFSVLPSLLSVAAVYHVARELELARGRKQPSAVPMLAALLLALADMDIYIAQETRMYAWHVLWVVLSMWAFLRFARLAGLHPEPLFQGERGLRAPYTRRHSLLFLKGSGGAIAAWITATTLLLYTQYIGAAAIAAQGFYALLFLRGRTRKIAILTLGFIGVLFIPWLVVIATGQTENVGTGFNVPSTLESLWNWRARWFTGQWALMATLAVLGLATVIYKDSAAQPWTDSPIPPYPKDATLGRIQWRPVGPSFLLLAWLVIPVTGAYILNYYTPILMDYRLTQITPAIALLIAFGLGNLRRPAFSIVLTAIIIQGVTTDDAAVKRPPWREVGQNAARYALPGDLALAHIEPSGDWQVMYYYERFMPEGVEQRSLRQWKREHPEDYPAGLVALLRGYDHVWFMHWAKEREGFDALAATGHIQTAVMTEDWLGNDLNVYRFDRVPPPEDALATFENGMVLRAAIIPADGLRVDLWWSADQPLAADYTISARLLDADGRLVAQQDSYPFGGERPTTTWLPGEVSYDPRELALVEEIAALSPGTYTVAVKVYRWAPAGFTDIPTVTGNEHAAIGTITIQS